MNADVRQTLMRYMWDHFNSPGGASHINRRLQVRAYPFYATYTDADDPSAVWMDAPVLLVICKIWLPNAAADRFMNFFYGEKLKYMGHLLDDLPRGWASSARTMGSPGGQTILNWYSSWRYMQDNPEARAPGSEGYGPFQMPRAAYRNWRTYSFNDDPLRIGPGGKGPQSATDVPVEWRLWVKGSFPEDPMVVGNHVSVRAFLERWFHNQGTVSIPTRLGHPQAPVHYHQLRNARSGDAVHGYGFPRQPGRRPAVPAERDACASLSQRLRGHRIECDLGFAAGGRFSSDHEQPRRHHQRKAD